MNATPSSETGKLLQKDWEILTITGFGTFPSDNPSKCIRLHHAAQGHAEVRKS